MLVDDLTEEYVLLIPSGLSIVKVSGQKSYYITNFINNTFYISTCENYKN